MSQSPFEPVTTSTETALLLMVRASITPGVADGIEREVKLRLADEAAWLALREALGRPQRVSQQTNTYFDTGDRKLRRDRSMMVRVREEAGASRLQIKDRISRAGGLLVSRERDEPLTPAAWRALEDEVGAPLEPLGSVANTREVYDLGEGYLAEVDRTELPGGRVDYEVEIELRRDEHTADGARAALEAACPSGAPRPISTPKYQRFLEAIGDG